MPSIRKAEQAKTGLTPSTKTYVTALSHNSSKWIDFNFFLPSLPFIMLHWVSFFFPLTTFCSFHYFVFMFKYVRGLVKFKNQLYVQLTFTFYPFHYNWPGFSRRDLRGKVACTLFLRWLLLKVLLFILFLLFFGFPFLWLVHVEERNRSESKYLFCMYLSTDPARAVVSPLVKTGLLSVFSVRQGTKYCLSNGGHMWILQETLQAKDPLKISWCTKSNPAWPLQFYNCYTMTSLLSSQPPTWWILRDFRICSFCRVQKETSSSLAWSPHIMLAVPWLFHIYILVFSDNLFFPSSSNKPRGYISQCGA